MSEVQTLPKPGQVIIASDANGNTWQFGVKHILAGNRLLCEWLKQEANPPQKEDYGFKVSIPEGNGALVTSARIMTISSDNLEFKILLSGKFEVVQRRAYFRLPDPQVVIKCKLHGETFEPIRVADISGGGLGLIVDKELQVEDEIETEITLPSGAFVFGVIKPIRIKKFPEAHRYYIGTSFVSIREPHRDKIIKYIFDQQIESGVL